MAKLYGWGAALVIVGALFKIMHWPGAGPMLVVGLGTEAVIFFFSAFDPLHEDPDWTLVYPELALADEIHDVEALEEGMEEDADKQDENKGTLTEQLDTMLEEAKIGPELIESLGEGLRSLTHQTNQLNDLADASVATNEYVSSMNSASVTVKDLADTYTKASESLAGIANDVEDGQSFGEQLQTMSKNLSSLNSVYELQLQGSSEHLETTNKLYDGISELMQNLNDSIDDTKKYKDNIAELSSNLGSLNTIYGNMLNAMNFGQQNNG
ncbi:MAG: gliding motility protein GldL [Salibacteraceae bacterium]